MKYYVQILKSLLVGHLICFMFVKQEMTDNFDHYTNTYLIYSKDLNKCQEFLATSDIINWKQHLQIQSKNVAWLLGLLLLTSVRSFFILITLSPDI